MTAGDGVELPHHLFHSTTVARTTEPSRTPSPMPRAAQRPACIGLTVNRLQLHADRTSPSATCTDVNYYGSLGNISAYAIGTDACNRGDFPVLWIQGGTQHPVIAQNMYRLKDGRFDQIGQSFLKHSAFQSTELRPGCTQPASSPPMGGAQLGVGLF